jgi:Na+/H+ antiporter NhaC
LPFNTWETPSSFRYCRSPLLKWHEHITGRFWTAMTSFLVTVAILVGATLWHSSQQQDIMRKELSDAQARVATLERQLRASPPLAPLPPPRGR